MTHDHKAFMDVMNAVLQAARLVGVNYSTDLSPAMVDLRKTIEALDDHLIAEATANYLEQKAEAQ